jgi:hypothetical protein
MRILIFLLVPNGEDSEKTETKKKRIPLGGCAIEIGKFPRDFFEKKISAKNFQWGQCQSTRL